MWHMAITPGFRWKHEDQNVNIAPSSIVDPEASLGYMKLCL